VAVGLFLSLIDCVPAAADGLSLPFGVAKDRRTAYLWARLALPSAQRAFRLLTEHETVDDDAIDQAVEAAFLTYKYLRGAQQGLQDLVLRSKFPDALIVHQIGKMQEIRDHVRIHCVDQGGTLHQRNKRALDNCVEHLAAGLARLEGLLLTIP
jgi:hypothetical protein